jgi:competence protein ComEC
MRILIIAFVAGVAWLQTQATLPPTVWAAWLIIPAALVGPLLHGKRRLGALRWLCFLLLAVGAGFFWAALIAQHRLADRLADAWEGRDLRLAGVVARMPQFTEGGVRFEFDVEQVLTRAAKVPRHLSLTQYRETEESADKDGPYRTARSLFHAGERWQLTVRLRQPHGTANPHGFDFEAWALENNIRAVGNVRPDADNFRDSGLVRQPAYLIERSREAIRDRLTSVLQNQPYAGVLTALAIGDQSAIPQAQWRTFWRTGVGHLISISGLHITMVGGLFSFLVYEAWRRTRWSLRLPARKPAALVGALAALAYALLAGFSVPTQRTVYMLAVVAIAVLFDRTSSPSRVLLLALLLVTLIDPWAPLAAGFWLSFGAVAFILYLAAARTGKPGLLKSAFNTQLAVTLGLLPILLIFFQQISLISPLANVIAIPVVSLVVVPFTLLGALLPLDFLPQLAQALVGWLMVFLDFLAQLPSVTWESGAPPTWAVMLGIAAVLWLLAPRGWPARWRGVVWLVPLLLPRTKIPPSGAAWATVLDVGQGLAVVVRAREHTLLYDTGPRWNEQADSGSRIVVPYLRGEGIRQLDGVVVTHADTDH